MTEAHALPPPDDLPLFAAAAERAQAAGPAPSKRQRTRRKKSPKSAVITAFPLTRQVGLADEIGRRFNAAADMGPDIYERVYAREWRRFERLLKRRGVSADDASRQVHALMRAAGDRMVALFIQQGGDAA